MKPLPQLQWTLVRRLSRLLLALLVVGAIVVGGLLYWKNRLDTELARRGQQLAQIQELAARMAPRRKPPLPALSPAAAQQLGRQMALLNRDWTRLSGLLAPHDHAVRLLGMDVDPATGAVRISGRVDSATVANTYAQALSKRADVLRQVRLLGLERHADGVRFEIGAQWID
ncbi:hypothetical protein RHOFW104T7_15330 [Rhodanobacter thiooxydans]|uniref:Fimbrial protein n=2 Tax=Rhodanobacter thiooxydans TaxID=416169 RepID=A0A154QFY4_9GAMM|nr:hypothetical protein UUA_12825 [Rhodanobacter thiooxydans LCS2]KZC23076.1 hypothetical protein RHOFW104T7_15330 [Rhodanobacter thiooxydans]